MKNRNARNCQFWPINSDETEFLAAIRVNIRPKFVKMPILAENVRPKTSEKERTALRLDTHSPNRALLRE